MQAEKGVLVDTSALGDLAAPAADKEKRPKEKKEDEKKPKKQKKDKREKAEKVAHYVFRCPPQHAFL